MTTAAASAGPGPAGFLAHARWRWAKRTGWTVALALVVYFLHDPTPKPNGGSWYGYLLGTIGAGLIGWLSALGIRKRRVSRRPWSLTGWTSAHVWLGLGLAVIVTLHTGFEFGRNVHTLAYILMMLVIVSGVVGTVAYAVLPRALSANRGEQTESDMIATLRAIDAQLTDAAQGLSSRATDLVRAALAEDVFRHSLRRRLSGRERLGATRAARDRLDEPGPDVARVEALLDRRLMAMAAIRRHLALRGRLEAWLYVHVPLTVALLAALSAHILSVLFYW